VECNPIDDVVDEARRLVDSGHVEMVVLNGILSSSRPESNGIATTTITSLSRYSGEGRVRVSSSN